MLNTLTEFASTDVASAAAPRFTLPAVAPGTREQLTRLAELRNIGLAGLQLATARGLLLFDKVARSDAWLITDSTRQSAQARRMDGQLWPRIGKKAYTLPRSRGSWPIGLPLLGDYPCAALVEGGPDLLAAFHFIAVEGRQSDCTAIAMLGANMNIPAECLPLFAGKVIRIYPHLDPAGINAALKWEAQLQPFTSYVDCFQLDRLRKTDETPVEDLNDLTSIHPDDFEGDRDLWAIMPQLEGRV